MAEEKKSVPQTTTGVDVKLAPVVNSDQPQFANFTRINGSPGMVFLDFGFLEPAVLTAVSRMAKSGGKVPERLNGKLAVRVALGYDTLVMLHQQLGQTIQGLAAQGKQSQAKDSAASPAPDKKSAKH